MLIKSNKDRSKKGKEVSLTQILNCSEIESKESNEQKRSRSVFEKFGPDKECPWMFGLRIETKQRMYELYAPTRKDLNHWIRIFNLIIEMNRLGILKRQYTPLMYERDKQLKAKQ